MAKRAQRRERKPLRAYRLFNIFLRATVGIYLRLLYRVRTENLAIIRRLEPPYLVLPNHMNFWDPFFLGGVVPHPIYYVTSDAHFRSRVLSFLLGLVGAIPKTKVLSDFETVRTIMRITREGGIVGIYPEGRRTWDGTTLPLYYSMARLIRLMRVPVVTMVARGAFLSLPRWGRGRRTGEVRLDFKVSFTAAECAALSQEEIFDRLSADLAYNEYDWQESARVRFRGRRPAEKLEQVLYVCPHCGRFGALFSRDARLRCAGCGYTVICDDLGRLLPAEGYPVYHQSVASWNGWQSERLIERLKRAAVERDASAGPPKEGGAEASAGPQRGTSRPLFTKGHITLYTGYRSEPLRRHPSGELIFQTDGISYCKVDGNTLFFPFSKISGANVQNNERLEFYHERILYSFESRTRQFSAYQWANALTVMKAIERGEGDAIRTLGDIEVRQQEGRLRRPKPVAEA